MARTVLEFEKPIVELEAKLEEMKRLSDKVNIESEISKIEEKVRELKEGIYKEPYTLAACAVSPSSRSPLYFRLYLFNDQQFFRTSWR